MKPFHATKREAQHLFSKFAGVAGKPCLGIGIVLIALVVKPLPANGESPAGGGVAVILSPRTASGTQQAASLQTEPSAFVGVKVPPHTSGPLAFRSSHNLFMGFAIAVERVSEIPSCRALFESLAASGVEMMTNSFYVATRADERREFCVEGVAAFTQVGSRVTRLCPGFGKVDRQTAALVLIHEALHSAGMPESPSTPGALMPAEISDLVKTACGL